MEFLLLLMERLHCLDTGTPVYKNPWTIIITGVLCMHNPYSLVCILTELGYVCEPHNALHSTGIDIHAVLVSVLPLVWA